MENLLPSEPILNPGMIDDFSKMDFDLTPDNSTGKLIITTHGKKGDGKTSLTFLITTGRLGGFPGGKTCVISFDNKTKTTKDQFFPKDDIEVHDGKKYYREDPKEITKSGMITYVYLQKLIEKFKQNPPDWIVIDGLTIYTKILEMAMRYKNGIGAIQGFANFNIWKDRGNMMQDIHNRMCRVAKYGVAYITYSEKDKITTDGQLVAETDVPSYIDIVMQETDLVLRAQKVKGKDGDLFYARVESTKFKQYQKKDGTPLPKCETTLTQGRTFDVTGLMEKALGKEQEKAPTKPAEPIREEISKHAATVAANIPLGKPVVEKPKPIEEKKPETQKPVEPKFEVPDLSML